MLGWAGWNGGVVGWLLAAGIAPPLRCDRLPTAVLSAADPTIAPPLQALATSEEHGLSRAG